MKCCNNQGNVNRNGHKSHAHPIWMMLLCCGAPAIILAAVSLLGSTLPGVRTFLIGILPFICPVMMLAMIPMMFYGNRKNSRDDRTPPPDQLEENNGGD